MKKPKNHSTPSAAHFRIVRPSLATLTSEFSAIQPQPVATAPGIMFLFLLLHCQLFSIRGKSG